MTDTYLVGAQIETPEGKFVDSGILQVRKGSSTLISPSIKGTALGGLSLLSIWALYALVLTSPFIFFHTIPITEWDPISRTLFAVALPAGFVAIILLGLGLVRRIEVKYPRTSRKITVLDSKSGRFGRELFVQSDDKRLVLIVSRFGGNLSKALDLVEYTAG